METSIVQYTVKRRLNYARQFLQTTDWSVKRIAIEWGVPNGPNFVRAFKRRFGMTPSQCQNNHRDGAGDNRL